MFRACDLAAVASNRVDTRGSCVRVRIKENWLMEPAGFRGSSGMSSQVGSKSCSCMESPHILVRVRNALRLVLFVELLEAFRGLYSSVI